MTTKLIAALLGATALSACATTETATPAPEPAPQPAAAPSGEPEMEPAGPTGPVSKDDGTMMKKVDQPALSAFTRDSSLPMAEEQMAVTLDSVDLALRVIPETRRIEGDATLSLVADEMVSTAVVELNNNFKIETIEIDDRPVAEGAWRNPEGRLFVDLPQPLQTGERVDLRIVYAGKPHVASRAPWDGGFVWAETESGQPWIATAVQLEGCDLFWPCIDYPTAEPRVMDIRVTVPEPLVAPTNGVLVGVESNEPGWNTYHWRTEDPNTYGIALNIGPYDLLEETYQSRYGDTVPMKFWYVRGHEEDAHELFQEFPLMLDFFEEMIGPYPFRDEKMGVVETPHKGMEHQTINAYGNKYVKEPYGYDGLLQHEFAHEWFANQLTNTNADHMWLHEGMGSYMQPLYSQWLHGDREYYAQLNQQRLGLRNTAPLVSQTPMSIDSVYHDETGPQGDIYAKGSLIMHSLRELIGDEAFFESIRRLVYGTPDPRPGNFEPQFADTNDYLEIVNQVTGDDLGWFFDVYLYEAALPELVETRQGGQLNLRWEAPGGKPFPMPVDVSIDGEVLTIEMTGGQGSIAVPEGAMVRTDPHSKILKREPYIEELQAFWKEKQAEQESEEGKG